MTWGWGSAVAGWCTSGLVHGAGGGGCLELLVGRTKENMHRAGEQL